MPARLRGSASPVAQSTKFDWLPDRKAGWPNRERIKVAASRNLQPPVGTERACVETPTRSRTTCLWRCALRRRPSSAHLDLEVRVLPLLGFGPQESEDDDTAVPQFARPQVGKMHPHSGILCACHARCANRQRSSESSLAPASPPGAPFRRDCPAFLVEAPDGQRRFDFLDPVSLDGLGRSVEAVPVTKRSQHGLRSPPAPNLCQRLIRRKNLARIRSAR